jgi:signal transduction histidine kinase
VAHRASLPGTPAPHARRIAVRDGARRARKFGTFSTRVARPGICTLLFTPRWPRGSEQLRERERHAQSHGATAFEMTATTARTVLLVDDDEAMLSLERSVLQREGHHVLIAGSGPEALAILEQQSVHLLVADYFMPGMSGEELIEHVRRRDPILQVILQTAHSDRKPATEMVRTLDIQGYHDKADGTERLVALVEAGLRAYVKVAELHLAERLKTELLAHVSHEFRTPIGVIVGYLDLMREGDFGPLPEAVAGVVGRVRGNASHLLALVEEFLDLSRLETHGAGDRRKLLSLSVFLRELGESFSLLVRGRPVEFRLEVPDGLPTVLAEPAKLRIIVQNLLANATKFTESGFVELGAETRGRGRVAITVRDTGPGIAPEHHEAIFDLYRQLERGSDTRGSLGLGLALARRFARLMDGDVTVQSRPGAGSTFTVILPVGESAPPRTEAAA